ncbi:iron-containing alcohol dehydrogenase [bacterium]|nr:MAG: iron-containing alcohol dehydrogenase [bacterium]
MKPFEIYQPTRILFGVNHLETFAKRAAEFGKRILMVTGGGSVKRLGYLDTVTKALHAQGIETLLFEGIEANPDAETINKAAKIGHEFGAEAVLAFGGGSVMDASKAIGGLIYMNEPDIWPFTNSMPRSGKMTGSLPILTIATTAATASEITAYGVISNRKVKGKQTIGYEFMKPKLSWMNPAFTTSLPLETTRDGAADIMSHVFENYILGGNGSPLADRYTEMVLQTVMETLPALTQNLSNENLRATLLWASDLALNGYQVAGRIPAAFVMHNMEHALSGYNPDLAHGRGLATLYPAFFSWMIDQGRALDRFAQLGRRLFGATGNDLEASRSFVENLTDWLKENGLYQSLSSLGIPADAFDEVAEYCVNVYGGGRGINALGNMEKADIVEVFKRTETQK